MNTQRFSFFLSRIRSLLFPAVQVHAPQTEMVIEWDKPVFMRDGVQLRVNVFRPNHQHSCPVIISFHPYGKDNLPKKNVFGRYQPLAPYRILRQAGAFIVSSLTGWEAPDPDFWVKHDYVVINADMRGFGHSQGQKSLLSAQEAEDYYDLIEWAANQSWSNGKIGLCGVSYLALSQYAVAALEPPHLAAICPWEGFSDVYKDLAYPGGIRENKFFVFWSKKVDPALRDGQIQHPLRDQWWQEKIPLLTKINTPTLICASFSDQSLHTHGSYRAFREIASTQKWLFTHRGGKWAQFYSEEALARQKQFFDYFLKGINNDLNSQKKVRLEVRDTRTKIHSITVEDSFPPAEICWTKLYLNLKERDLRTEEPGSLEQLGFPMGQGQLCLNYTIPEDLQIIGPAKIKLHVKAINNNDINIFVGLRKWRQNEEIYFEGSYGYPFDIVTKGWQKASLRAMDEQSSNGEPEQNFIQQALLKPEEIVCLEFPLMPAATFFQQGDILQLQIQTHWFFKPSLWMSQLSDYEPSTKGECVCYSGTHFQSYLVLPIFRPVQQVQVGA